MTRILVALAVVVSLHATARAGTVTGRVIQDGFRVAEYGVYVGGRGNVPLEVRDGDGRFTLRDVPAGMQQIIFVGWAFEKRSILVDVRESGTTAMGNITVDAGRTITGRVVDAAGEPVEDATVLVFDTRPVPTDEPLDLMADDVRVATSGFEGRYRIHGVPDGKLRIMAVKETLQSAEQFVGSAPAELAIGGSGTITGKVTNRRAMRSPVVTATLAGVDGKPTLGGVDPAGNFRFDLPAGVYELALAEEKTAPMQVVVVAERTRTVTLVAPSSHADLVVVAPDCYFVKLYGARPGAPAPRTEIGFESCEHDRVRFDGLAPGSYRVCVDGDEGDGTCRLVTLRRTQTITITPQRVALPRH